MQTEKYQAIAKSIAKKFRSSQIDAFGCTYDDYQQDLRLLALQVSSIFRERVQGPEDKEKCYVARSLRHRSITWQRHSAREYQNREMYSHKVLPTPELCISHSNTFDLDRKIDAKIILEKVFSLLSEYEQDILLRVGKADGNIELAWDPEKDEKLRSFERRVERLRIRVKKILEKQSFCRSFSTSSVLDN